MLGRGRPCGGRVQGAIAAGSDELATGTVGGWPYVERGDGDIASRLGPETVAITARRIDDADCRILLRWVDPGFNRPGLGELRPE